MTTWISLNMYTCARGMDLIDHFSHMLTAVWIIHWLHPNMEQILREAPFSCEFFQQNYIVIEMYREHGWEKWSSLLIPLAADTPVHLVARLFSLALSLAELFEKAMERERERLICTYTCAHIYTHYHINMYMYIYIYYYIYIYVCMYVCTTPL